MMSPTRKPTKLDANALVSTGLLSAAGCVMKNVVNVYVPIPDSIASAIALPSPGESFEFLAYTDPH